MQGHGRTADINRDFSYENLADDIAAMLDYLKIKQADLLGYSMGGGVAMQVAIRHPEKVRKVVSISAVFRHDGWVKEALDVFPQLTADIFKGSPIETEYKKLSPTPDEFPNFVKRVIAMDLKPYDFGADKLKATKAPFLFIHGDADGVRLDHIAEMFRLKGDEIFGDMRPRSESRLAVLPNTTHVTLMEKAQCHHPHGERFPRRQTAEELEPRGCSALSGMVRDPGNATMIPPPMSRQPTPRVSRSPGFPRDQRRALPRLHRADR